MLFDPIKWREKVAEIAPVIPNCPRCNASMRIDGIFPHPRLRRVEIVSFICDCGSVEKRVVPHAFRER
jgi:hypothetical protein